MENKEPQFSAEDLYKTLTEKNDPSCLSNFVTLAEMFNSKSSQYDVVQKYLQISGNCKEILQLIKGLSECDSQVTMVVMNTISHILLRVGSDLGSFMSVGKSIVTEILSSGMKTIQTFLKVKQKSSRTKHALHLLSAMVALGGQTAQQVVSKLNLTSITFTHLLNRKNFSEEEDVRTAFINLIIIILMSCDKSFIRQLAEIKGFLNDVIPGLVSDRPHIITLVLSTFQKLIVENPNISKSTKLKLFSDYSLKSVIKLYSWKGPVRDKARRKRKLGEDDISIAYEATEEEISSVHIAAHEFMLSLCSFKTGIAFYDPYCGTSGKKNNVLTIILNSMPKPHTNKLASEFVCYVLKTCPDQMTFYLPSLKDSFYPRDSLLWVDVVNIVKEIILLQDPASHLLKHKEKQPVSTLVNIAISLTFPNLITVSDIDSFLKDGQPFICFYLGDFLICVLEKVKNTVESCLKSDFSSTPYSSADVSVFCQSFLTTIMQKFTFMKDLEECWEKLILAAKEPKEENDQDVPIPPLSAQLYKVLDLIQHFLSVSQLANQNYDLINLPKLFQNLKNCQDILPSEDICKLNSKLVDIIAAIGEEIIMLWNEKVIDSPLMVLFDIYMSSSSANAINDVSQVLKKVLEHTKVFEYCPWEINVWLDSIKSSKSKHLACVLDFFNNTMRTLLQNPAVYSDEIIENTFEKSSSKLSLNVTSILNDILSKERDPILIEMCEDSSSVTSMPKLCFSSLVPAALSTLKSLDDEKKKVCQTFLEKVLYHILHHQQSPEVLLSIIKRYKKYLSFEILNYVEFLCPSKYETRVSIKEENLVCKADLSEHLKIRFLSLHLLPSSSKGCSCNVQLETDQLEANYKEKLIWQILIYLNWELTLLLENKIETSDAEKYLSMLENILVSLDFPSVSKEDAMEITETESEDKDLKYKALELIFSHPVLLKLFLWAEKVPKSQRPLLKRLVYSATEFTMKFASEIVHHELYSKHLTGFKDKIVKYNSLHFQVRNWPKGSVMYENPDICQIISNFSVLFSSGDVTDMLEDVLKTGTEDVKVENYFPAVTLLYKMCVESQDFIPLSPKTVNTLFTKFASLTTKQKKVITEYTVKMFKKHPDLTCAVSADSCHLLLKQHGCKNFYLLGSIIDCNEELRKIIQTAILENLEELKSTADFLYLVSKCVQHLSVDDEQDKDFLENVSLLFWEVISAYILVDIASPDTLLENSGTGKALQVLFHQKTVGLRKVHKFFEDNSDTLFAAVPDPKRILIFLDLMSLWKNYISKKNKPVTSFLKLIIHWLTESVSSVQASSEFDYFPLLNFAESSIQDISQCFDLEDLIEVDIFFPKILKVALKYRSIGNGLIKILTALCDKSKEVNLPTSKIFNLVTGHSNFFNIMLSFHKENDTLKECITDLLITLVKIDKSVCRDNHVGLILSSYTGTLKSVDQKLLYLIKLYSESDVDMSQFSPFLWSKTAIVHYSVMNSETNLLWKKPKLQDLLNIFVPDMIVATAGKYPLHLKLDPVIPDAKELENCSDLDKIYDLRFFLPLFANLLSPGSYVHCRNFMDSKVLMLIFTSLSSFDERTRSLGYYCLSQLYFHLEGAYYAEKEIWLCLLDSLRNSITSENPRVPSIVTLFLARTAFIFTKPDHFMFQPLYNFITVKPCLDIDQVPEFYKLFNSVEKERMWLLELLADGLQSQLDFHISEKRYIFSLLLTHYCSSISTLQEKIVIFRALSSAIKTDKSAQILCHQSLLTWLHNIIENIDSSNAVIIKCICTFLKKLWHTIKKSDCNDVNEDDSDSISENSDAKTKRLYFSFANEFLFVLLSFCKKLNSDVSLEKSSIIEAFQANQISVTEISSIDTYFNEHLTKFM